MANYHLEIQAISRGKGRSVTKLANYITSEKLYDRYADGTYYHRRRDILYREIFLPDNAPPEFHDLQHLCDAIEAAEVRYDARTAREFKGSLPNELSVRDQIQIVRMYVNKNFVDNRLCAIVAIHEGRNLNDPSKNNPHAHIIVPTRTVGPDGFSRKKDREHDKRQYISIWREQWALVQNAAYERNGLDLRISHESLEVQGIEREPTCHLSRIDWQREQRGERTLAGDKKRAIEARNREQLLTLQRKQERCLNPELELSR